MSKLAMQVFKDLLVQAINNLQQLKKLLQEEELLLQKSEHTPEELEAITQAKSNLLQAIYADIAARKDFLLEQQLSADLAGVDEFLIRQPEKVAQALRKGWNQLVNLLEEVQAANSLNARLINRGVQHFDLLLNAFKTTQSQGKVYSPAGSSGSLNSPGNLGRA